MFQFVIVLNVRNSPIILIEGGMGALPMQSQNHIIIIIGVVLRTPFLIITLRDFEVL